MEISPFANVLIVFKNWHACSQCQKDKHLSITIIDLVMIIPEEKLSVSFSVDINEFNWLLILASYYSLVINKTFPVCFC